MNDVGIKYRHKKFSQFVLGYMINLESYDDKMENTRVGNSRRTVVKPGVFVESVYVKRELVRTLVGISYYTMSTGTSVGGDSGAFGINGLIGVNCRVYQSVHINL